MIDLIFYHTPLFYLIQSLWRDEAFSYFMAKPNILQVIINTAHDFNPPFYYLILHFWTIIFGKSDEFLRLLSFFPHLICVYFVYLFARKCTTKKIAVFIAFFTFLNPMLLYYAFEMRMYSFYALFAMASLYFFQEKNWKLYLFFTVLGLYTHSFFLLILFSYFVFIFITKQFKKKIIALTLLPLLFFLPWLPVIINQFFRSKDSWIFPVDWQLIKSVLGNLFTGYEGTPGELWKYTALLSGIIIFFFFLAFRQNKKRVLLLLIQIFIPLTIILGYSLVKRPIYVNRYMIFVSVYETLVISMGIAWLKNKLVRALVATTWLMFVIAINIITPTYHKKTDFKNTFAEINKIAKPSDSVFAKTPICFLESAYYFKYYDKVFIYNPNNISIPPYIGTTVVFPQVSKVTLPPAPSRTFLINDDASFELLINL